MVHYLPIIIRLVAAEHGGCNMNAYAYACVCAHTRVCDVFCFCVSPIGADLKERAEMNHSDSDLFVHGLLSLLTEIGGWCVCGPGASPSLVQPSACSHPSTSHPHPHNM